MNDQVLEYFRVSYKDINMYVEELEEIGINKYKNTSDVLPARPSMNIQQCYVLAYGA